MKLSRSFWGKQTGFSLIELMIVVGIIGILGAIAIPSYMDYLRQARLSDASSGLATKRVQVEQFFQDNRTYDSDENRGCQNDTTSSSNFDFSCTVRTATTYTIQATGKGDMAGMVLTVDQDNNRRTTAVPAWSGWSANNSCWITGKGGSC